MASFVLAIGSHQGQVVYACGCVKESRLFLDELNLVERICHVHGADSLAVLKVGFVPHPCPYTHVAMLAAHPPTYVEI